ncbi:hypothetical protein DE146DRAFT_674913 [Phaeosphaeria sp. MPI-PUGE-AT-0046c]|nr:hypothetical protein DE146DRAFT_674913 [Phaeosphaeria sp. MPI-PUGE-AT-0046c]
MDWPIHKIICKDYTTFVTTRPDFRFDHASNRPDVVHLAQLGIRGYEVKPNSMNEFSDNPMLARNIENHHIIISMPDAEDVHFQHSAGVTENNSLAVIDEELTTCAAYGSTLLAFASHCPMDTEKKLSSLDLGPVYFRHVVDNLRMAYCKFDELIDNMMGLTGTGARTVRLDCMGDTNFFNRGGFESVLACPVMLDEQTDIPTPVADKIGISLVVRKIPPAVLWPDFRRPRRIENSQASMLNPPDQSMNTGSLVIVRRDGKPLHPVYVHALITYTALKLKDPKHSKNVCLTADTLLPHRIEHVSKEDFQKWYPKMWQLFPNCPFVPSPFDIPEDFMVGRTGFNLRHK